MRKSKGFASVLGASAGLSFGGFLAYLLIIALVNSIFHLPATESAVNWAFIYIPLLAAIISFFTIRKPSEWKNVDDRISFDLCPPLWMISVPIGCFIISRKYGSLEYFATTADLNYMDLLYICVICFVFTLILSLIIPKMIKAKQEAAEAEERQRSIEAEKSRQDQARQRQNEIKNITKQMEAMDIYSIDILPFLRHINFSGNGPLRSLDYCIDSVVAKSKTNNMEAQRLNQVAEQLNIPNRVKIHFK